MDVAEQAALALAPWVPRRLITTEEYHRMADAGILTEDDRVELIEGELVTMSPIGSDHTGMVNWLTRTLVLAVGDRAIVSVQNPVRLNSRSEPQPDFALLRPRPDDYRSVTPAPDDVLLIIEIANSSLNYDRTVKRPLYARSGIPEFWIVDLSGQEVEVCRGLADGAYRAVVRVGRGGALEPHLLPGVVIRVDALLA